MRIDKKTRIVIITLFVAIVLMTIAFATLSKTLNINYNNVTETVQVWNISFINETVNGTPTGTSSVGLNCGDATASGTNVTINSTLLSKPGDKCQWHFRIKNYGTIDGYISNITFTAPKDGSNNTISCTKTNGNAFASCGKVMYKLTTDSLATTKLKRNTVISENENDSNNVIDVYLNAIYDDSDISTDLVQVGALYQVVFSQQ